MDGSVKLWNSTEGKCVGILLCGDKVLAILPSRICPCLVRKLSFFLGILFFSGSKSGYLTFCLKIFLLEIPNKCSISSPYKISHELLHWSAWLAFLTYFLFQPDENSSSSVESCCLPDDKSSKLLVTGSLGKISYGVFQTSSFFSTSDMIEQTSNSNEATVQ